MAATYTKKEHAKLTTRVIHGVIQHYFEWKPEAKWEVISLSISDDHILRMKLKLNGNIHHYLDRLFEKDIVKIKNNFLHWLKLLYHDKNELFVELSWP